MPSEPKSIDGVVHVEWRHGDRADAGAANGPILLVEVPHGADRIAHYDELRGRLQGDLPDRLEDFFCINTDVGAWQLGVAVAERVVEAVPSAAALLVRSLIPRTFIDCNRPASREASPASGSGAASSKITAGIPPYVRDEHDIALLTERHARYVEAARAAYALCMGAGGLAMTPHTYGPHTLDIPTVDERIVTELHRATQPEALAKARLRAEIDLLTRDGDGHCLAPDGLEAALLAAFEAQGYGAEANATYHLHPATLAHHWSATYPGRVLCLEVRRDLLVEAWTPFAEMSVDPAKVEPLADVLAAALAPRVRRRGPE